MRRSSDGIPGLILKNHYGGVIDGSSTLRADLTTKPSLAFLPQAKYSTPSYAAASTWLANALSPCYTRPEAGDVAKLADAHDLGSCAARRAGSTPAVPTRSVYRNFLDTSSPNPPDRWRKSALSVRLTAATGYRVAPLYPVCCVGGAGRRFQRHASPAS